ncbi:MAG: HypC/HybG/HupF family hydrogenase formation chaperone [Candidatus Aenigmarchaeota archaeon]|nr:HypC/HybG/HupF family hydrogenase formation chaperone [Candidatus Aenigmarchaeota archaeon]
MCLAFPAKIVKKMEKTAIADFGGSKKEIKILLTPDVKVGDWVLVHAGFSIQKLEEEVKEYEILFERKR